MIICQIMGNVHDLLLCSHTNLNFLSLNKLFTKEIFTNNYDKSTFLLKVTMLILKPNVKHSTSVLLMELVVLPNTASFVPMEPYSTRTTSSVTGGSTLIVPLLRTSTASMMKLLLKEMLLLELQTNLSMELLQNTEQPLLQLEITQSTMKLLRPDEDVDWEEDEDKEGEDHQGGNCRA